MKNIYLLLVIFFFTGCYSFSGYPYHYKRRLLPPRSKIEEKIGELAKNHPEILLSDSIIKKWEKEYYNFISDSCKIKFYDKYNKNYKNTGIYETEYGGIINYYLFCTEDKKIIYYLSLTNDCIVGAELLINGITFDNENKVNYRYDISREQRKLVVKRFKEEILPLLKQELKKK